MSPAPVPVTLTPESNAIEVEDWLDSVGNEPGEDAKWLLASIFTELMHDNRREEAQVLMRSLFRLASGRGERWREALAAVEVGTQRLHYSLTGRAFGWRPFSGTYLGR